MLLDQTQALLSNIWDLLLYVSQLCNLLILGLQIFLKLWDRLVFFFCTNLGNFSYFTFICFKSINFFLILFKFIQAVLSNALDLFLFFLQFCNLLVWGLQILLKFLEFPVIFFCLSCCLFIRIESLVLGLDAFFLQSTFCFHGFDFLLYWFSYLEDFL